MSGTLKKLTFITGNASKAEQLSRHLDFPIAHRKVDLVEVQSLDLMEVVEHEVKEAYKLMGSPVLIEDTSLIFNALGRLPGPLIKWFLAELDNEGLARLLDGYEDRSAKAEVLFGLYDGKTLKTFSGSITGTVPLEPRGGRGFGWDPIFIPDRYGKTWGEMDAEEQKQVSMRRIALKKLEAELRR